MVHYQDPSKEVLNKTKKYKFYQTGIWMRYCISNRSTWDDIPFTWMRKEEEIVPGPQWCSVCFLVQTLSVSRGVDFSIEPVRNGLCEHICCRSRYSTDLTKISQVLRKEIYLRWQGNLFIFKTKDSLNCTCLFFSSHSEMSRRGLFWGDRITFSCDCFMQGLDIWAWIKARTGAHWWPRTTFGSFHSFLWMREK